MGKFVDLYKKTDRIKGEELAFDYIVKNLLSDFNTGNSKIRDINGHNMEQFAQKDFIPSMFYIFMYVSQDKGEFAGDKFYDMCPLVLCTGSDTKTVKGINFNFLPNNVRAALLDILTGDFKDFYNDAENGDDELKVNRDLGIVLKQDLNSVIMYIKMKTGLDVTSCVRTYSKKNIIKARMIEYDQWKYIPFLTFKDAVRGINLAKLQADFIEDQHKSPINKEAKRN